MRVLFLFSFFFCFLQYFFFFLLLNESLKATMNRQIEVVLNSWHRIISHYAQRRDFQTNRYQIFMCFLSFCVQKKNVDQIIRKKFQLHIQLKFFFSIPFTRSLFFFQINIEINAVKN